jgi:hypothetical protein
MSSSNGLYFLLKDLGIITLHIELTEIPLDIYYKIFNFLYTNYNKTCITYDTKAYMESLLNTSKSLNVLHTKEYKH